MIGWSSGMNRSMGQCCLGLMVADVGDPTGALQAEICLVLVGSPMRLHSLALNYEQSVPFCARDGIVMLPGAKKNIRNSKIPVFALEILKDKLLV